MTLAAGPDSTAVRVALWRALHVLVDAAPHVLEDEVGLRLVSPDDEWRQRPDMDVEFSRGFRAAIVARSRFVEDLVAEEAGRGVTQYVILGAGLDTFAQRCADLAGRPVVFEIDRPATQAWKRRRLVDLGYGLPDWLRFVPVDFEQDDDWHAQLADAGFDSGRPAVVACAGVTMYLTRQATADLLRRVAGFATGSTLAMTFIVPPELVDDGDRAGFRESASGARSSGTPFVSFYTPDDMLSMARAAGFRTVRHVSGRSLADRYFADRPDGLRPSTGEDLLIASP